MDYYSTPSRLCVHYCDNSYSYDNDKCSESHYESIVNIFNIKSDYPVSYNLTQ